MNYDFQYELERERWLKWARKRKQIEQLERERNKEDSSSRTGLDQTE
jgi:hypothetical protein